MITGRFLGCLGCMLWLLNIATSPKAEWIGVTVGIIAVLSLMAGTIVIGAKKGRTRLGIGLALLSVVFGLGLFIVMLVPEKDSHHAA